MIRARVALLPYLHHLCLLCCYIVFIDFYFSLHLVPLKYGALKLYILMKTEATTPFLRVHTEQKQKVGIKSKLITIDFTLLNNTKKICTQYTPVVQNEDE